MDPFSEDLFSFDSRRSTCYDASSSIVSTPPDSGGSSSYEASIRQPQFSLPINIRPANPLDTRSPFPTAVNRRPVNRRSVNPPVSEWTPPHSPARSSSPQHPQAMSGSRPISPFGDRMFACDPHPPGGTGGKYHMPTFGGRPGPGAFATCDEVTGESNDASPFARRMPVDRRGGWAQIEKRGGKKEGSDEKRDRENGKREQKKD